MAVVYNVAGMTCGGCVKSVTAALTQAIPGAEIEASHEADTVSVEGEHTESQVKDAVEDAGFDFGGPL